MARTLRRFGLCGCAIVAVGVLHASAQGRIRGVAVQRGAGPVASSFAGIITDGDSVTMDTFGGTITPYPPQVLRSIGRFNVLTNAAVSGYTTADIIAHLSTVVEPQFAAWSARPKIYTLMIGTNDNFGHYSDIVGTICPTVVAAGARMVLLTGLPWNNTGEEAHRQSYNTLVRNGANGAGGNCVYTVADVASDSRMGDLGDQLDTTYYRDTTHLTTAGAAIVASYVVTAIQALGVQ